MKKRITKRSDTGFIRHDGQRVFAVDPADISWRIRDDWLPLAREGHNLFEHPILPYIEREAVSRLSKETGTAAGSQPHLKDGYDEWRLWWTKTAHAYVSDSCTGLSTIAAAAARMLVSAAEMRSALDKQDAQVSALLGMQIGCDAIMAGYGLTIKFEAGESSQLAYDNGLGKEAGDYDKLKAKLIDYAKSRFSEVPSPMIGAVAKAFCVLQNDPKVIEDVPNLKTLPDEERIKTWLRKAAKTGELLIPAVARKAGRPRSKKK